MGDYILRLRERVGSDLVLQMPSVSVAVRDDGGRLLMVKHREHGRWLLPGGSVEPGELPADAALRECWEETGLLVGLTRLAGVFGGPEFVVEYENGDRASYVMAVFDGKIRAGELSADPAEVLDAQFFAPAEARSLELAAWVPGVLPVVLDRDSGGAAFQAPSWQPPSPS